MYENGPGRDQAKRENFFYEHVPISNDSGFLSGSTSRQTETRPSVFTAPDNNTKFKEVFPGADVAPLRHLSRLL